MREVTYTIDCDVDKWVRVCVSYTFRGSGIGKSVKEKFLTLDEAVNWLKEQEGVEL